MSLVAWRSIELRSPDGMSAPSKSEPRPTRGRYQWLPFLLPPSDLRPDDASDALRIALVAIVLLQDGD
jgi:hypothetical protein